MIRQTNLIPLAIEINSHAIERAYTYFYPEATIEPFILIDIGVTQLTFLFLAENKKVSSFSESLIPAEKECLLQQIKQGIHTLYLSYPYTIFSKLFFMGTNLALLKFLVEKLNGLYALKTEMVSLHGLFPDANTLNKEFVSQFPALFLSFGLALRGFNKAF